MNRRRVVILGAGLVVSLLVVLIILMVVLTDRPSAPEFAPLIEEIILGTPRSASQTQVANPKLRSKSDYSTTEGLALRVVTNQPVEAPVTVSVRLVDDKGVIHPLEPSTLQFSQVKTTFCCWTISEAGTYTLQVFRPDASITSIPLKIMAAPKGAGSTGQTKFNFGI